MANCLNDEIALGTLSAVHAGKEVTAHEKPLNFYGKSAAGYIILYLTTGAGAYMIAGGENGGDIVTKIADILGIVGFAAGVIGTAFSVPFLTVLSIAISVILLVKLFIDYLAVEHKCQGLGYLNAITVFTSVASIFSKPLMSVVLLYTGLVAGNSVQAVAQSQTCKV